MIVFLYGLCICLCIIGIFFKFSNHSLKFLGFIALTIIIIIMANGDTNYVDLRNYETTYNSIGNSIRHVYVDRGYYYIQLFAKNIGLSFMQFRLILFFSGLLMAIYSISKFNNNICMFVLAYSCYFAIMDGEQLRNFMSFSFIVLGLQFLYKENKFSTIKYIICNLIAVSFHAMAVVYFVFLIYKLKVDILKILKKVMPLYIIIMLLIDRVGSGFNGILSWYASISGEQIASKLANYSITRSNTAFIIPSIIYIAFLISIDILNKKSRTIECLEHKNYYMFVESINLIGIIFIPLCFVNLTFYRIIRNITYFDLIYFTVMLNEQRLIKKRCLIMLLVFVLILGWQIWDFSIYQEWKQMSLYFFHK